ncbi:MAG: gliding motility protein GldL [Sphingobacteriia bacterium]|nr:gliding motility protein GldL [Sphingobacteriia bacterium]
MSRKKKSFFETKGWKNFMKYLYGLGAAVVIIGALFKILHLPGANIMLIVGLGVEAMIFAISAFEPLHEELDWTRAYPELIVPEDEFSDLEELEHHGEEGEETPALEGGAPAHHGGGNYLAEAGNAISAAKMGPELLESLSESLEGLKNNVSQLANITDATVATEEYSTKIKQAAHQVDILNNKYEITVDAMSQFSNSVEHAKAYHEQVQTVTRNLSSLNAVYELELQDAQAHLRSMNQFFGSLSSAMNNMMEASKDTEAYKHEVAKLTQNMNALNTIYGNMLTAMNLGGAR